MSKKLETIKNFASVQETAKELNDKGESSLIEADTDDQPEGLVTEHDIPIRICINDTVIGSITDNLIMSELLTTANQACTQHLI